MDSNNNNKSISPFAYLKRLYTKRETAAMLSCTTRSLENYVNRGLIVPHRGSRHVMFTPEAIESYVEKFQSRRPIIKLGSRS